MRSPLARPTDTRDLWLGRITSAPSPGRLFLLDGASGAGKTSIAKQLADRLTDQAEFVRRYTTRPERPGDQESDEYVFVEPAYFAELAAADALIEHRDFDFGMSYGLPWRDVGEVLLTGRHAIAIMNLGRLNEVRKSGAAAIVILIDVPEDQILRRLEARGVHRPEQLRERLDNARSVIEYRSGYDYVVDNSDGRLALAIDDLERIVRDADHSPPPRD